MPRIIKSYVRIVEAVNHRIGRMAMYLIFALMAILKVVQIFNGYNAVINKAGKPYRY